MAIQQQLLLRSVSRTLRNKSFNAANLAYSNNKEYLGIE